MRILWNPLWWMSFAAIKLASVSLAGWSWWWILLAQVPLLSLVVRHFNL